MDAKRLTGGGCKAKKRATSDNSSYAKTVRIDVNGVPKNILALIDDAVNIGRFESRSEAIVAAIVHALRDGAV
jgi:hypothetical protein